MSRTGFSALATEVSRRSKSHFVLSKDILLRIIKPEKVTEPITGFIRNTFPVSIRPDLHPDTVEQLISLDIHGDLIALPLHLVKPLVDLVSHLDYPIVVKPEPDLIGDAGIEEKEIGGVYESQSGPFNRLPSHDADDRHEIHDADGHGDNKKCLVHLFYSATF